MACLKICAGDLREKAIIRSPRNIKDSYGGTETAWYQKGEIYCTIKQGSGSEGTNRQHIENRATVEFITRYRSDLRYDDEIIFDCWPHNVIALDDIDRRKQYIKITTRKGDRPIDRIDLFDNLITLPNGEEVLTPDGESVVLPLLTAIKTPKEINVKLPSGKTVTNSEPDTCGV